MSRSSPKISSVDARVGSLLSSLVGLSVLSACPMPDGEPDASSTADAGAPQQADACDQVPASSFTYPEGPYGSEVGDKLEDFELRGCDGVDVKFSDVLATSKVTMFNVGAGWCAPCIEETMELEEMVYREHCDEGLAVVQVLFQDANANPATSLFCSDWKNQYSLTFPVLIDPLFETGQYFDAVLTPMNMLVDTTGTIRFKEVGLGATDELDTAIAELLAE